MQPEMVYAAWVPAEGVWSLWARPVLFAQMAESPEPPAGDGGPAEPAASGIQAAPAGAAWIPRAGEGAMLVVDLPGEESVRTGLALAGRGYRPVPLYNACTGPQEVIDQGPILRALRRGATSLRTLTLAADAPPAFLLDDRRMSPAGPMRPGAFDNRWQVFPEDFPSARLLTARGFRRAVLVQRGRRQPQEDLAHVLRRWQDAGIAVEAKDVADGRPPLPITVASPRWYRALWHRALAILGLRRCRQGGFGRIVPEPGGG